MKFSKLSGCGVAVWACVAAVFLVQGCRTEPGGEKFAELPATVHRTPAPETNASAPGATTVASPAPTAAASGAVAANATNNPEILKVGDELIIAFSDMPIQQMAFGVPIKGDGTITLMYDDTFHAAGKTAGQLEQEIRAFYVPDYFKNMTVTVTLKEQTRFYYIGGEVKTPGRQQYTGPITLLEAIKTAGDFTDFAQKHKVQLTRADGKKLVVDCIKARKDRSLDPPVYAGDDVFVPRRIY